MNNDVDKFEVTENTSRMFDAWLENDGQPLSGDMISTLLLTVRQDFTGEIINDRDDQNVFQTNGVTIEPDGHLVWQITPLDTKLLNRQLPSEPHRCLFEWSYDSFGVTKYGAYEFVLWVRRNAAAQEQYAPAQ